jgi:glycosyltransferase involved in cell wall biosynthesis
VASVLASEGVELELVVLDDHSSDATARIVQIAAEHDARVRLERAPELPAGWCGKVHACHILSQHARHPLLAFIDADVRLAPDALRRFASFMEASGCDLASGVPSRSPARFSRSCSSRSSTSSCSDSCPLTECAAVPIRPSPQPSGSL